MEKWCSILAISLNKWKVYIKLELCKIEKREREKDHVYPGMDDEWLRVT